jgi:multidrug resistance efflux pump
MPIDDADEKIEAATRHLAALDRKLAKLERSRSRTSTSVKLAREERNRACRDLQDLVELAELPIELMGWA